MRATETTLNAVAAAVGTAMIIAWFLALGPIGFALLVATAYAMVVQNLALGIVCGLLLASPLMLTAVWVPLVVGAGLRERWAREIEVISGSKTAAETVRGD